MSTTTTQTLQSAGYTCRRTTIAGQGYLGGDGVTCYRVYGPDGALVSPRLSTWRTARQAWAEVARLGGTE